MSNFVSIGRHLLYDLWAYILCIILNYKNLQFKQFIDNIATAFLFSRTFTSKKIDSFDNYITWIEENSLLIEFVISHDVMNLSSS